MLDPIVVADVVLDAMLAADAEGVRIEPAAVGYTIAVTRAGEQIAGSLIDDALARDVIARLGFVCNVEGTTGRTRVRSSRASREVVLTIQSGLRPRAELIVIGRDACTGRELAEGDVIGHYRIVAPIGAGGMGDVYEAIHETLGRRHAVKVLARRVLEHDRAYVEQFVREAQAAARVRSPHIVEVYDFGYLADGRPYLVMELLAGTSLGDVLLGGRLAPKAAIAIARQLAEALAAAHERSVIHGDVTPANILLDDGHVTLIDFGLARLREATRHDEPSDAIMGTPRYIAPEQVRGYAASEATDQYAFGIVLFEMLAGHAPFSGATTQATCWAHLQDPVPPIAGASPQLMSVIERCLAKQSGERFPSMAVIAHVLASFDGGVS
jgi:serine/threonine protein kinase